MKIYLATDHTGIELKDTIKVSLEEKGYIVEDFGAFAFDKDDDYPDYISKAAKAVSENPDTDRGIVFGGSGEGEAMVANKFPGIRCALFYFPAIPVSAADVSGRMSTDPFEIIRLTREHNNANMLSLSARFLKSEDALKAVLLWLETPFSGEERHVRRVEKIKKIEEGQ